MEVKTESKAATGSDADSNVLSINIDSIPDKEPAHVHISKSTDSAKQGDVPIDLEQLVIDENGYVQTVKRELSVSVDHISGSTTVSVLDGESKKVIREIPQNEVLAVEKLITAPAGMLFRAHA